MMILLHLMNLRLKYSLLFISFGIITYVSTKLWPLAPPYPNILNLILLIFTLLLGVVTILFFVKIFVPKAKLIELLLFFMFN